MKLPEQVGVMLLPDAILFPRVLMPLQVFEPRYRRMLTDCLRAHRMFAVALHRHTSEKSGDSEELSEVAGLGLVRACVQQSDGTARLMLQGVSRVRLRDVVIPDPHVKYPHARIEPLGSHGEVTEEKHRRLLATAARLVKVAKQMGNTLPPELLKAMERVQDAEHLADFLSYALLENPGDKQVLLETLDVPRRFNKLLRLLRQQIRQLEFWRKLQGSLPQENIGYN